MHGDTSNRSNPVSLPANVYLLPIPRLHIEPLRLVIFLPSTQRIRRGRNGQSPPRAQMMQTIALIVRVEENERI